MSYKDNPAINFSTMKFMGDCPLEYAYRRENPPEQTAAMLKGSAFHAAVLQPDIFARDFARKSDKTAGDQAQRLADKDYDDVICMAEAFNRTFGSARDKVEYPIYWTDELTGLGCKGLLDEVNPHGFTEIKTTTYSYMNPDKFGWHCIRMQWDVQLAFYHDGLGGWRGEPDPTRLIVVQSTAPYDIIPYEVPHYVIEDGRAKYLKYLRRIKECRESAVWPGRSNNGKLTLVLPQRFESDDWGEDDE